MSQVSPPEPVPVTFAAAVLNPARVAPLIRCAAVMVFPAFIAVPTTATVNGRFCRSGAGVNIESLRLIRLPSASPMRPTGVMQVGPAALSCQHRAWAATPPPATRWQGPMLAGTTASN